MQSLRGKHVRKHIFFISLLVLPFFIYFGYTGIHTYLLNKYPPLEGVHAMANGTVMNKYGTTIADAVIEKDGSITLNGKVIGSMYLGDRFSTSIENLPDARQEPEMIELHDGDIFELTAGYVKKEVGNRTLRMLAYNGSIPGPIIKVPQGAEITVNFNNNTDIEQTVHSHGVRLDNPNDGVPGETQESVEPGESFSYTVKFPDAGVYWYHPHVREDYAQEMGLYGNYIVEPDESGYWSPVNREVPLVVDDVLMQGDQMSPFYKDLTNFALLGRFGNEYLVNGEENYTLDVKGGEVIRFYITNVSNVRTYNLSIPNAKLKLIGADISKFEHEMYEDSVLISPAERVVVEAYFPQEGEYDLVHTTNATSTKIAHFSAKGKVDTSYAAAFNTLRDNEEVIKELDPLKKYRYAAPDKKLFLTVALSGPPIDHSKHVHAQVATGTPNLGLPKIQWEDPGASDLTNTTDTVTWELLDDRTRKINGDIDDWVFKKGQLVKMELMNDPNAVHVMQHPFHLHGQRFVILDRNGVANDNLAWKDTVMLEPGEVVNILVDMSNPGVWMAHCHIAEHLEAGMALSFRVENEDGTAPGDDFRKAHPAGMQH
jgi:FtsP/CotA-like multicopper oxidase with cupredoxin domain